VDTPQGVRALLLERGAPAADARAARRHVRVEPAEGGGGAWLARDLCDGGRVEVNGRAVPAGGAVPLAEGDVLGLLGGGASLEISQPSGADGGAAAFEFDVVRGAGAGAGENGSKGAVAGAGDAGLLAARMRLDGGTKVMHVTAGERVQGAAARAGAASAFSLSARGLQVGDPTRPFPGRTARVLVKRGHFWSNCVKRGRRQVVLEDGAEELVLVTLDDVTLAARADGAGRDLSLTVLRIQVPPPVLSGHAASFTPY
jgi:hypothetical protein